jgi:predicted phosphodiesterase
MSPDFSQCRRVLVIADIHAFWNPFNQILKYLEGSYDLVLQLGDWGLFPRPHEIFDRTYGLKPVKSKVPILVVPGNHENYQVITDLTNKHGRKEPIRLYKNIWFLPRGCLTQIGNKKVLACGGAYSIDKAFRKEGISWWKEEEPNYADCQAVLSHDKVDVVAAHTIPNMTTDQIFRGVPQLMKIKENCAARTLLDEVVVKYCPETIYAGHWHTRITLQANTTKVEVYDCICSDLINIKASKGIIYDIVSW